MDALEAIRTRRMIPRVKADRPSREAITELLECAVRAPTHHLTEPWRFHVLTGEGLERLAAAMAQESTEQGTSADEAMQTARTKVGRAPVVIAVTCIPSDKEGVIEQEEIVSTGMALQNLLLAAHAKGLGAMLRTGTVAYHPAVGGHLGLEDGEKVVGLVYLGHPEADRSLTPRAPASEKTRWVGWD